MQLTYVFPILILLFIGLFFLGCPSPASAALEVRTKGAFRRQDAAALSIITLAYAAAAFAGLGDTDAPQSFHEFQSGESAVIDLGQVRDIDSIMIYSGLNTGSYRIEASDNGKDWFDLASFEQSYVSLFKWNSVLLDELSTGAARYLRFTAAGDVRLGELAIRCGGELCGGSADATELFDEQDTVPEYQHYTNSTYFDEIYHARTALEHLEGVYPYEVSHPPLGKLIIAIGIALFGMTPFGWRFSGTLTGILMLPVLYMLLKRMFSSTRVCACATAIFAFDFMHFTQTRIATIDSYAVFFILLMYLFIYMYVTGGRLRDLALSGLFFGIGAACKWTCLYAGAGLALIWLIHWIRDFELKAFLKNCAWCLVFFVLVPAMIYYASYFPYGQASGMHGVGMLFTSDYADLVLGNQKFMFSYHSGVHAEHPYSSRWWQWIIDERPILYYLKYFEDGTRSSFGAFLNPVLCWAGLTAMALCAVFAVKRRDRLSQFIVIGYLAQLLPWVFITRTTFEYHYFPSSVFLVLAIARVFSLMEHNTRGWRFNVYGLTGLSCALFILFYPVLSGVRVNAQLAGSLLKWLPDWPF